RRKTSGIKFEVESVVARDVKAIIYFVLAVIFVLSLRGNFGVVGDMIIGIFKPIFGWGIYAVPVLLVAASIMMFFAKKIQLGLSRMLGLGLMMLSVLSIFHLSVGMEDLYQIGREGAYGGLIGFVTNFVFRQILRIGHFGSSIVFLAIFVIGVLFAFSISFSQFINFFRPGVKLKRVHDQSEEDRESNDREPEIFVSRKPLDEAIEDSIEEAEREIEMRVEEKKASSATRSAKDKAIDLRDEKEEVGAGAPVEWKFPAFDILSPAAKTIASDENFLKDNADKIRNKLEQFGIEVTMHEIHVGPTVIQYTLRPFEDVKLSRITALKNDLALALAAKSVRIEAPIPGKSLVGVEVPNEHRSIVHLREILESKEFQDIDSPLRIPLGRDVSGKAVVDDLASMPHLLIAGATGSGKSVGINSLLLGLLYQNSPVELKLIMIDPKRVELSTYNNLPYLLTPIVTDIEKATIALRWAVAEMHRRYQLFTETKHRNIGDYNKDPKMIDKIPRILVVIDELAELMMATKNEVEFSICRIAQMGRAVGIHLVVATQRPSVDVITGLIKANIPARIAYAVSSQIDSRTILDGMGAEDLLGKGDMLYLQPGMNKPVRIQGIYVSPQEIDAVTSFIKINNEAAPDYNEAITARETAEAEVHGIPESVFAEGEDVSDEILYKEALRVIYEHKKASASLLQRRLKLGYARAARILDLLEKDGYIGPVQGAKPRDIHFDKIKI
ncbi:DNA translocase FtsK 4TM domain-containing protein, partial [Candidatus Peregrinibacteria bacterium]|nr:DNA translocase FtsK 4TM domain-containing protein [Candidatus Peregrinibacteria bacterium]